MSSTIFFPTGLVAGILILVSGYTLFQSFKSIANIKKYESRAEKAAEWSDTAGKRLWETRYTIGAGFVSCLVSLLTALAYCTFVPCGDNLLAAPWRTLWPAIVSAGLRFGSARYMHDFWATKAKMPLLDQYNAAVSQSMEVIGFLEALSVGWAIVAVLKLLGL